VEEVKMAAHDYKEERKWKVALAFTLSKQIRKKKQEKIRGEKELFLFHRGTQSMLSC